MIQNLMMKELDVHVNGKTVWITHDETSFLKMREHSHMIWLEKYNVSSLDALKMHSSNNHLVINVTQK